MTCDLKKLGWFFFFSPPSTPNPSPCPSPSLPEMKPSALMMLAGTSAMLMWESVMRMHTTALAPGLPVKRDLNIEKWHRGLSHVKPETPRYHRGVAWPWIEAEGYTTLLCFCWCHSHSGEKTHSLHQSGGQIHGRRTCPRRNWKITGFAPGGRCEDLGQKWAQTRLRRGCGWVGLSNWWGQFQNCDFHIKGNKQTLSGDVSSAASSLVFLVLLHF